MKAKYIFEANFQRNIEPKRAMRTGDPIISVELSAMSIDYTYENNVFKPNLKDEDTKYFYDVVKKNNIDCQFLGIDSMKAVEYRFTGRKKDLIPLLTLFDAWGRSEKELAKALKDWYGDPDELGDVIF